MAASQMHGYEWIDDFNAGVPLGTSFMPCTIGNSQRWTSARGYLGDDVKTRRNLRIGVGAWVTRVHFDTNSHIPRAIGVEVAEGLNGTSLTSSHFYGDELIVY